MKSIISKLTIALGVLFLTSCREIDEVITEAQPISSKTTEDILNQKNDSVKTNNILGIDVSEGDPPPKNGQQWKY